MADQDLQLQIVIDALLKAKGFEDAQAAIAGLTDTTNKSAAVTSTAAKATEALAEKQDVSKREVKILTQELLRSIGATEGVGAAGRVAAEGLGALQTSANLTNLAIASSGLAVVLLIPKIIEWISHSKSATTEQEKLRKEIVDQLPELEHLAEATGHVSAALERQLAATRALALIEQQKRIDNIKEELKGLREQIPLESTIEQKRVTGKQVLQSLNDLERQQTQELTAEQKAQQILKLRIEERRAEMERLIEAQRLGVTIGELDAQQTKKQTATEAAAKRAEEERLRVIKDEAAFRRAFALQQERDAIKDMAAGQNRVLVEKKQIAEVRAAKLKAIADVKAAEIEAARIHKQLQQEKTLAETEFATATISGLGALFGKQKDAAIANAIINTWQGATLQYTSGDPYTAFARAAAVVAQGFADIANIEAQSGGFDDPANDLIVSQFGRKWAKDMVDLLQGGFRSGVGDAMRSGSVYHQTTINRGSTINVTANGVIGTRTGFRKWLEREMTLAERQRARTSI